MACYIYTHSSDKMSPSMHSFQFFFVSVFDSIQKLIKLFCNIRQIEVPISLNDTPPQDDLKPTEVSF